MKGTSAAAVASRLVAGALLVPLFAVFSDPGVGWGVRALVVALGSLTAMRPATGLAALMLLLPLVIFFGTREMSVDAVADVLLVTFAAAAAVSHARIASNVRARLGPPVIVLIAAVVASSIVEIHQMQAAAPRAPVLRDLWRHLTSGFWTNSQAFVSIHHGVRWIAGLSAALSAEMILRHAPASARPVVRSWLVSGAVGGLLTIPHVVDAIHMRGRQLPEALVTTLPLLRESALQPDLNAAGSHFALFLLPAVLVALATRARWLWFGVVPLVFFALWMARSRAALASVVLVLCAFYGSRLIRTRHVRLAAAAMAAGVVALAGLVFVTSRTHVTLATAAEVRLQLVQIGVETARRFPVFGVGLGDYIRMTRRYIEPEMLALRHFAPGGENAHNNYLQILVELGLPAALIFTAMVGAVALSAWRTTPATDVAERQGMALGLTAFLVSACFGHPLLQPVVFAPFFVALGVTAGLTALPERRIFAQIAPAGAAFYFSSLLVRLR